MARVTVFMRECMEVAEYIDAAKADYLAAADLEKSIGVRKRKVEFAENFDLIKLHAQQISLVKLVPLSGRTVFGMTHTMRTAVVRTKTFIKLKAKERV